MKIKRHTKGVRVQYPKASEVFLTIRPTYFSESMNFLEGAKEKRVMLDFPIDPKDPSKKGPHIIDNYKEGAFLWEAFDHALESWEGIDVEQDEGEAPLGPKEVKKVLYDDTDLREFVMKTSRELAEGEEEAKKTEEKNS